MMPSAEAVHRQQPQPGAPDPAPAGSVPEPAGRVGPRADAERYAPVFVWGVWGLSLKATLAFAFWWLADYPLFRQHLDAHCRRAHADPHCIVYHLTGPGP